MSFRHDFNWYKRGCGWHICDRHANFQHTSVLGVSDISLFVFTERYTRMYIMPATVSSLTSSLMKWRTVFIRVQRNKNIFFLFHPRGYYKLSTLCQHLIIHLTIYGSLEEHTPLGVLISLEVIFFLVGCFDFFHEISHEYVGVFLHLVGVTLNLLISSLARWDHDVECYWWRRCIDNDSEVSVLKSFEYFYVWVEGRAPQLDAISPDGFKDCLIQCQQQFIFNRLSRFPAE